MKRDMALIRQLMLNLENDIRTDPQGFEKDVVTYHKALLIESELALGAILTGDDRLFAAKLLRLTWQGHEFIDAARDENGWRQIMKKIANTVGTTSIPVIQAMLIEYATGKLK